MSRKVERVFPGLVPVQWYKSLNTSGYSMYQNTQWPLPTQNDDGSWTPGRWTPQKKMPPKLCAHGWHVMPADGILDWLHSTLYAAQVRGEGVIGKNKAAYQSARLLYPLTVTRKVFELQGASLARELLSARYFTTVSPALSMPYPVFNEVSLYMRDLSKYFFKYPIDRWGEDDFCTIGARILADKVQRKLMQANLLFSASQFDSALTDLMTLWGHIADTIDGDSSMARIAYRTRILCGSLRGYQARLNAELPILSATQEQETHWGRVFFEHLQNCQPYTP